jgi:LysM repeat protein
MNTFISFKNFIKLMIAGAVLLASLGFTSGVLAQSTCGDTYTVQKGDYLTKIARTCGVTYADLLKANPTITTPSRIYPGQVINIPTVGIPVTGAAKPVMYTVKAGDTLYSISQQFAVTVTELREANPAIGSTISTGQVLNIPARIRFATGGTAANVTGKLEANSEHAYLLYAAANQTLEVALTAPAGATLAILGADGTTLSAASSNTSYRGVLPKSQDTILVVASGNSALDYSLSVDVPQRIIFAAGSSSASLTGSIPANLNQYFIIRAAKDQTLTVSATPSDKIQLTVYGVDGTVLKSGMSEGNSFSSTLPSTQDYMLVLKSANQVQSFTLNVSIPGSPSIPVTGTNSYSVKKGDTLYSIAKSAGTTVAVLMRANPEITDKNTISVGPVIYLPGATVNLSDGKTVYIVNRGESLGEIAKKFNITLNALTAANPQITNINLIYTGQRINIP